VQVDIHVASEAKLFTCNKKYSDKANIQAKLLSLRLHGTGATHPVAHAR